MDRLIGDEERIRRAEEVLEFRRNRAPVTNNVTSTTNLNFRRPYKILVQIFICTIIYIGMYSVKKMPEGSNVTITVKNVMNNDVNFNDIFKSITGKIKECSQMINNNIKADENNNNQSDEDTSSSNDVNNNLENKDHNKTSSAIEYILSFRNNDKSNAYEEALGIGGENITNENSKLTDESQMIVDSKYIKDNVNLVNPLENGVITSPFGERESSNIVSSNHKGIDLGASAGTTIISASDGTVIEASSAGDFGTHLKIQKDDITVIYGHCSELLVQEGEYVFQGQQIAKVGSTGKATGPHLHFEIRRTERAVDPQLLIDF